MDTRKDVFKELNEMNEQMDLMLNGMSKRLRDTTVRRNDNLSTLYKNLMKKLPNYPLGIVLTLNDAINDYLKQKGY